MKKKGKQLPDRPAPGNVSWVFWIHVKPRSHRDEILGWDDRGYLEVHTRARPEKGDANRSCCKLLSRILQIPHSHVQIEKGWTSVHKKLRVEGVSAEEGKKRVDAKLS